MFGNKRLQYDQLIIRLDGCTVESMHSTKFLSVYLDEKLKWTQHLNHITAKMSRGLGVMGRVRTILPQNIVSMLYFTLIYPYLIYCSIIWGGASATALHKLEVFQNRAVRLIIQFHVYIIAELTCITLTICVKLTISLHRLSALLFVNSVLVFKVLRSGILYPSLW